MRKGSKLSSTKEWYEKLINKILVFEKEEKTVLTNESVHKLMCEVDSEMGLPVKSGKHAPQIKRLIQTGGFTVLPDDTRKGHGREKPVILEVSDLEKVKRDLLAVGKKKVEAEVKTKTVRIPRTKKVEAPKPVVKVEIPAEEKIHKKYLENLYRILSFVRKGNNPVRVYKLKEACGTTMTKKVLENYIAEAAKVGVFITCNPDTVAGAKFDNIDGAMLGLSRAYEKLYKVQIPHKVELKVEKAIPVIRRAYSAPSKSEETSSFSNTEHDILYLTAGLIRSTGATARIFINDICTTLKNIRDEWVDSDALKKLISREPELSMDNSCGSYKVFLTKGNSSWEKIKSAHGPHKQEIEILARIHTSLKYLQGIFGENNVTVEVDYDDYDGVYRIKTHSDEVSMSKLRELVATFRETEDKRRGDFFITKKSLFEKLRRDNIKIKVKYSQESKRFLIDSEAWLEVEAMKK